MPNQLSNNGAGWRGFMDPGTAASEFGALSFVITSMLSKVATATLVKVVAVTNHGGVEPVGFVDLLPLVNQLDGAGNAVKHATVFHCPYLRLQGGANAIILDPQVGDIGIAVFASRDISSVAANRAQSNPGSWRQFSMADALYLGGVLNGLPTQYVQFTDLGIVIHSPNKVTLEAPQVQLDCQIFELNATASASINTPLLTVNGDVRTAGALENNGVDVGSTHRHSGVSTGVDDTGVPV